MQKRISLVLAASALAGGVLSCERVSGSSPNEIASILVHDEKRGGRALREAISLGDDMLQPLRTETSDFTALEVPNLFLVAKVLACNASPASGRVLQELLGRPDPAPRLIGAVGMAAHGRLPDDQVTEEYLLRIAGGRFDDKEKATALIPGAPSEFNSSTLTGYRHLAIQALGLARNEQALDTLISVLRDREIGMLHGPAAEALAEIGSQRAVPALQETLKQDWFEATPEALRALIRLNDRSAPGIAVGRLSGDRYGLLARELQQVTGANPGSTPEAWGGWWEKNKDTWKPVTTTSQREVQCGADGRS